jgi:hypothetical protein
LDPLAVEGASPKMPTFDGSPRRFEEEASTTIRPLHLTVVHGARG